MCVVILTKWLAISAFIFEADTLKTFNGGTVNKAKKIFMNYGGNYFHMQRDGILSEYKSYAIDKSTEKMWLREYQETILKKIKEGYSLDVYLTKFFSAMRQIREVETLQALFNPLVKSLKNADTFIKLRVAEEMQEFIVFFNKNHLANSEKISDYKKLTIEILKNIIAKPIVISETTRKNVVFDDTLSEENIKKRAQNTLNKLLA